MHVIEWVTKTVNRDGKNLRHLKSKNINLFQSFLYFFAFNLVFTCPTFCHLKTTCLLLVKQKLYALDAFFIEKLKLSENDPDITSFVKHLELLLVWMFHSEGQATFQWATQTGIPRGTLEIVIQEVLWSIRGPYSAIWSLPLTNVRGHSNPWPTVTSQPIRLSIPDIYPRELQLNKANTSDKETSFLD